MAFLELCKDRQIYIVVPKETGSGVLRIAEKVACDIRKTSGAEPLVCDGAPPEKRTGAEPGIQAVFAVTDGGELAKRLAERIPGVKDVCGKRESYAFYLTNQPLDGIAQGLVIYGSDRLGTIYGLFHLSELLGVTPYVYWGDADAVSYQRILLSTQQMQETEGEKRITVKNGCSREPSVKYRGFFINDEWPCFGNWTFSHFGGFTAQMYDHVFEYLLRLKGNYIWPAMWTSSFLLDGPGMESMELADAYGIYVGMSHHEPCMRSGEEWDLVKGEDSPYGTDWSYVTNQEGLLRYWEDGLKRSVGHHVFPTIGMRGERDSKMLGDDADVSENVRLLREIITKQREMIARHLQPEPGQERIPQLFAVYKEVEDYYFGDGTSEGLRNFEELTDVTLLLCEDNFGNMRALPKEAERTHPGGFGMYYHLDYHGDPVSYEWMPSVPLSKIWEQMTQAYEYGIRELWIVNVGDLKFQEYPLGFFMDMAYDFETWGSAAVNQTEQYTGQWLEKIFGAYATGEELERIRRVLDGFININALRRPESLHAEIYHPAHDGESRRMMQLCSAIEEENEEIRELFIQRGMEQAYESMIYYPAAASVNLLKMHLYAGWNHLYAKQGKAAANEMGERMDCCVLRDEELAGEIAAFRDGKWSGMELASHIGFTNWNDEDWRYPVRHVVRLPNRPRLVVSRADETKHFTNQYFPKPLCIEMECGGAESLVRTCPDVCVQIANGGQGTLRWQIEPEAECDWLDFSAGSGETALQDEVVLSLKEEKLHAGQEAAVTFRIRAGEEFVPVRVRAVKKDDTGLPERTFTASGQVFTIPAIFYAEKSSGDYHGQEAGFEKLYGYGKYGSGIKVFPVTASFAGLESAPSVTYRVFAEQAGAYCLRLYTSPANPLIYGGELHVMVSVKPAYLGEPHDAGSVKPPLDTVKEKENPVKDMIITGKGYKGGEPGCLEWERAVLDQEHVAGTQVWLEQGINLLTVYAQEAGIVLERIQLHPADKALKESYLGPAALLFTARGRS